LAVVLTQKAGAAPLSAPLTITTVKAAKSFLGGEAVGGCSVSPQAKALADGAINAMPAANTKLMVAALLVAIAVASVGLAAQTVLESGASPDPEQPRPALAENSGVSHQPQTPAAVDSFGDPLPEGAVARLGTVRFRPGANTRTVAYAPNGKVMASAGLYGIGLCFWDVDTGRPLHKLSTPPFCFDVAFSPDSKMVCVVDRLVDVASGKEILRLEARESYAVAFSPDGKYVALGSPARRQATVILFDVRTGKEVRRFEWDALGASSAWPTIAFAPDGKTLVTGSRDKSVRLWDVATGKELKRLEGHQGPVHCVAVGPDGKYIASAGEDGEVRLWDISSAKLRHQLKAEQGHIYSVAFSPNGKLLASGGQRAICLWDVASAKELRRWAGHEDDVTSLAFSPSGKVLASAGSGLGENIRRWDPDTGQEIGPVAGHTTMARLLQFAPDGKTLVSCGQDVKMLKWDLATGRQLIGGPQGPPTQPEYWVAGDLSFDAKMLAVVRWDISLEPAKPDPVIHLWDTGAHKEIHALNAQGKPVGSVRFSPDAKLLSSVGPDGIHLWDATSGKHLHYMQDKPIKLAELAFSPDSKLLAYPAENSTIRVWDLAAGKERHRLKGSDETIIFSPDGKLLASGDGHVWSATSGKELQAMEGRRDFFPRSVAFSPTGRVLGTAGETRVARQLTVESLIVLWEVCSGQVIRQIDRPSWAIYKPLAFSPDGRTLACGEGDSTILLWDVTGQPKSAPLSGADLTGLWSDLAADASKANRAIWGFAGAVKQTLPFLKDQLRAVPAADAKLLAMLIGDLDSPTFAVRQKAGRALEELGEKAEGAIRKMLAAEPTLEVRRYLEQILKKGERDVLRRLRAIDTLEQISTPRAREVLESLAKSTPNPRIEEAAVAALSRLDRTPR
jgi:WD40 repeat protein